MNLLSRALARLRGRPKTVDAALGRTAARYPRRVAVICDEREVDYATLAADAGALASALRREGVAAGDRLAILMPNRIEWLLSFFAGAQLGCVVVPVDTFYAPPELRRALAEVEVSTVVTSPELRVSADNAFVEAGVTRVLVVDSDDGSADGDASGGPRFHGFDALLERGRATTDATGGDGQSRRASAAPERDFLYLRTSGTTGAPKGVMLSQTRALAVAHAWRRFAPPDASDRCLTLSPLFRSPTLLGVALAGVYHAVPMVMPTAFRPEDVWRQISDHGATLFHANPFHFAALAEHESADDVEARRAAAGLKQVYSTGNRVPPPVAKRFRKRFGVAIEERYGTSEVGAICKDGRPMRGVRIRLVDDDGADVEPKKIGEIIVRTPLMASGYHGGPAASRDVFRDGWFYTGDLGRFDDSGKLIIVARKKTTVWIDGGRVYADVVRRVLRSHPAVRDAVVLRENPAEGSAYLRAVVVPSKAGLDSETLAAHCRSKLHPRSVPREIELRDELPRSWKSVTQEGEQASYPRWGEA